MTGIKPGGRCFAGRGSRDHSVTAGFQTDLVAQEKGGSRQKTVFASLFCVALSFPLAANAQSSNVRFQGGIGSQALGAGAQPNDVNGVQPGGRPWVISRLIAEVIGRRIIVHGQGLLIAGGGNIGTGAGQSVRARLFCGGVPHDSAALVPLATNGDFRIDSVLSPAPPRPCTNPVLLIINANDSWFAAGIPKN